LPLVSWALICVYESGGELTDGERQGGGFQVQARLPLPPEQAASP
jgi:hypothetical protein